jgi:hypothetical protein
MYLRLLVSAFLSASLLASATTRPIRFAPAQTFPSGIAHTTRVAVGDFNGDGYPDLAVSSNYNHVAIFLGKGDGTFGAPTIYRLRFYVTGSVVVGDFNDDGKLDLAIVGGTTSEKGLAFLAGNGDGTFQAPKYFKTELAGASIVAVPGDFNHDGQLDLFVGGNGACEVVLGDGKGNFHDEGQLIDAFGFDVAAGDFNQDGNLDAAATQAFSSSYPPNVAVLLGNSDGTFQSPQRYSGMDEPSGVATGDFNGDKKLDLAVTDSLMNTVVILEGNGDGTFNNIGEWYAGAEPGAVVAADFNKDGKVDLAVSNFGDDGVSVLQGKGDGTFPALAEVPTALQPAGMVAVDLNHDGSVDLVVVNHGADSVSVLLNAEGTYVQLTSSLNPSKAGQVVTFTANVQGSVNPSATPSGTVTFKDGSRNLGHVHLSQGQASLSTSVLRKGTQNITATYSGDDNFAPNESEVLVQVVD